MSACLVLCCAILVTAYASLVIASVKLDFGNLLLWRRERRLKLAKKDRSTQTSISDTIKIQDCINVKPYQNAEDRHDDSNIALYPDASTQNESVEVSGALSRLRPIIEGVSPYSIFLRVEPKELSWVLKQGLILYEGHTRNASFVSNESMNNMIAVINHGSSRDTIDMAILANVIPPIHKREYLSGKQQYGKG